MVSQVEVYKVHHHGSRYSSNETWLAAIQPRIGIISAGSGNGLGLIRFGGHFPKDKYDVPNVG